MRPAYLLLIYQAVLFVPLGGCAPVSADGLRRTNVELSIPSAKTPRDFAMCAAGALPDAGQVLNDGEHYWVVRTYGGTAFERWDFTPTATGSVAERRSGQLSPSFGSGKVRGCAGSA